MICIVSKQAENEYHVMTGPSYKYFVCMCREMATAQAICDFFNGGQFTPVCPAHGPMEVTCLDCEGEALRAEVSQDGTLAAVVGLLSQGDGGEESATACPS